MRLGTNISDYFLTYATVHDEGYWMSFPAPKSSVLWCQHKVQMEAGDLPLRDFPVLPLWIGAPWMGARLDHR